MNATNLMTNMPSAPAPKATAQAKPGGKIDQFPAKNSDVGADKAKQEFGDVLDQATGKESLEQTDQNPDEPQQAAAQMPMVSGFVQLAAIVEIASLPISMETAGAAPLTTAPTENQAQSLADQTKSTDFSQLLKAVGGQVEPAMPGKVVATQQIVSQETAENQLAGANSQPLKASENQQPLSGQATGTVASSQELLTLLNAKVQANPDLTAVQAQIVGEKPQQLATNQQLPTAADTAESLENAVKPVNMAEGKAQQENLFSGGQQRETPQEKLTPTQPAVKSTEPEALHLPKAKDVPVTKPTDIAAAELKIEVPEVKPQPQINQFIGSVTDLRTTANQVQTAPTPAAPETLAKYNISDQIVEQARMIKTNEDTQMIIKLKPEHLGELTLKVTVENGIVSAAFHSDNAQVRSMLETSLLQLKQELAVQGIKVDSVGVYAGLGQFMSNGQQQAGREQQQTRFKNRKVDLADFEDEVGKVSVAAPNKAGEDGVDYRV